MAEHKHAAVLRAIADGKDVQLRTALQGVWIDFDVDSHINPITSGINAEWRIKPEPKPDSVHISRIALRPTSNGPQTALVNLFDTDGGKVQYTFDGETGKLKSAEVLP